MKVAPVNFCTNSTTNFSGISKIIKNEIECENPYRDDSLDYDCYYFPFKDENKEEIDKMKKNLQEARVEREYTMYGQTAGYKTFYSEVYVQSPLQITQAQYDTLKKDNVSDDTILKTFA